MLKCSDVVNQPSNITRATIISEHHRKGKLLHCCNLLNRECWVAHCPFHGHAWRTVRQSKPATAPRELDPGLCGDPDLVDLSTLTSTQSSQNCWTRACGSGIRLLQWWGDGDANDPRLPEVRWGAHRGGWRRAAHFHRAHVSVHGCVINVL